MNELERLARATARIEAQIEARKQREAAKEATRLAKEAEKAARKAQQVALDRWVADNVTMRFNLLGQRVELFDQEQMKWRELRDVDSTELMYRFARETTQKVSSSLVHETLRYVAYQHKFDPLKESLDALPAWDGTPRLDTWLTEYAGAVDSPYTRMAGRRWLLGAMARAYKPGCKADLVLILHGFQGLGKSRLLSDLAGAFFNDASFNFENEQKAGMALRDTWIHEWAELDSMSKASHTRLKAFVSECHNRFRPPYGREMVVEPRRCVFAGSSNKDDFLTDATGNRRFLPVGVTKYARDAFLNAREQLLAEVREAHLNGERHYLSTEEETMAAEPRNFVSMEDVWAPRVGAWLEGQTEITMEDALAHVGLLPPQMDKRQQFRMADLLHREGWAQNGRRAGHRSWKKV